MRIRWLYVLRDVAITWTLLYFTVCVLAIRALVSSAEPALPVKLILNLPLLVSFTLAACLGRRPMTERLVHVGVVASMYFLIGLPGMLMLSWITFGEWLTTLWQTAVLAFVGAGLSYALAPPRDDVEGDTHSRPLSPQSVPAGCDPATTGGGAHSQDTTPRTQGDESSSDGGTEESIPSFDHVRQPSQMAATATVAICATVALLAVILLVWFVVQGTSERHPLRALEHDQPIVIKGKADPLFMYNLQTQGPTAGSAYSLSNQWNGWH